ncbi:hypothetical protein EVAR_67177_1 [Eumeta japonica]|uniref:Uncharacterized protein n=1 Tax=Eumeta variegata TaxID=151549 RepID=A0A4C1ZY67_EUMVA|nr:hypothetical protein EVAR_67177_1 [Eumeta japonica]
MSIEGAGGEEDIVCEGRCVVLVIALRGRLLGDVANELTTMGRLSAAPARRSSPRGAAGAVRGDDNDVGSL